MTNNLNDQPVFDTVQAMAAYGRPEAELMAMMETLRPNAKRIALIFSGSIDTQRVMGFPTASGHYSTLAWGTLQNITTSALAVGDIHTDADGVTWEIMANVTFNGTANWPSTHVFCAVKLEVPNDKQS